jgi:hypothetical protein
LRSGRVLQRLPDLCAAKTRRLRPAMKHDRSKRRDKPRHAPRAAPPPSRSPLLIRLHADSIGLLAFRGLVVAMQAATIVYTWPLWQVRTDPPLLPALPLPQIDFGWLLLASLAVVLAAPRAGLAIHFALLGAAMLLDQWRVQPEFVSMGLLMLGTLDSPTAQFIARAHLVALWTYAGLHKLLSDGYYTHVVPAPLVAVLGNGEPWPSLFDALRGGAAVFEMSLGLLALIPRTRKLCAWLAVLLHLGILQYLMFWVRADDGSFGWNKAVWPWNVALALAGLALVAPWRTSPLADWRLVRWPARGVALVILFSPIGFYMCWMHPYLAHCLYSSNIPQAAIVSAEREQVILDYLPGFPVPFPPIHSVYEAYFEKVARPGDTLYIVDSRWWAKRHGFARRRIVRPPEHAISADR